MPNLDKFWKHIREKYKNLFDFSLIITFDNVLSEAYTFFSLTFLLLHVLKHWYLERLFILILLYKYLCETVLLNLLSLYAEVELLAYMVILLLIIWYSGCTILHSPQTKQEFRFLCILTNTYVQEFRFLCILANTYVLYVCVC